MTLIHKFVLTDPAAAARRMPRLHERPVVGGGGGGWRGIRASIRRDMERRAWRGGRNHVGTYDVPVAAIALANPLLAGGIRGRRPVRRMPWVPGAAALEVSGALAQQVSKWRCRFCGEENEDKYSYCWSCGQYRYQSLRRADLRAARRSCRDRASAASPARARARAWDVAARFDQLCTAQSGASVTQRSPEGHRCEVSNRATTSQSRPARMAPAHRGAVGRTRDLRRAA